MVSPEMRTAPPKPTVVPVSLGFKYACIAQLTLIIGTPYDDACDTTITNGATASSNVGCPNAGAVYVYLRSGASWVQQAYIKASNAEAGDSFGQSVSLSGNTLVVGASAEQSNQTAVTNGSSASADNSLPQAGAAYVFVRNGTTWTQQAYLKQPNVAFAGVGRFGTALSVSGDTIVVGAFTESNARLSVANASDVGGDWTTMGIIGERELGAELIIHACVHRFDERGLCELMREKPIA